MATITDVSQLANVSKATVSRVMSGSRGVKKESREAVLRAAEELNYRPNVTAQNLANKYSNYIGVILSTSDAEQVSTYLPLLSRALMAHSKHMLVNFADTDAEYQRVVSELTNGHCDAVIALDPKEYKPTPNSPVISLYTNHENELATYYKEATEQLCVDLHQQGHHTIAVLLNYHDECHQQVLDGYKNYLNSASMSINPQLIQKIENSIEFALMQLSRSCLAFSIIITLTEQQAVAIRQRSAIRVISIESQLSTTKQKRIAMNQDAQSKITAVMQQLEQLSPHK